MSQNADEYVGFDHHPFIEGKLDIQISISLKDNDKDINFILSFHE